MAQLWSHVITNLMTGIDTNELSDTVAFSHAVPAFVSLMAVSAMYSLHFQSVRKCLLEIQYWPTVAALHDRIHCQPAEVTGVLRTNKFTSHNSAIETAR
jgi:hypothetical protein